MSVARPPCRWLGIAELIGRPEIIKEILCRTATDLGREQAFQGFGVVGARGLSESSESSPRWTSRSSS